jgi:hypothetical protein
MGDVLLARQAPLVGMVAAGVDEGLLDALAVDRRGGVVGVLLDDREQVPEQLALGLGQRGVGDRDAVAPIDEAVDRRPLLVLDDRGLRGRDDRGGRLRWRLDGARASVAPRARAARLAAAERRGQPLGGGFALLRNRFPSSYRLA